MSTETRPASGAVTDSTPDAFGTGRRKRPVRRGQALEVLVLEPVLRVVDVSHRPCSPSMPPSRNAAKVVTDLAQRVVRTVVARAPAHPGPAGTALVGDGDDGQSRRRGGPDAIARVLDGGAPGRVDPEPADGLDVDVGVRLATRDLGARDGRREVAADPHRAHDRVDDLTRRRRGEPDRDAEKTLASRSGTPATSLTRPER